MNYIKLIKNEFEFLKDCGYTIEDEEESLLWEYVRYINREKKRLISISFDLRENLSELSIWKLNRKDEALDINHRSLKELLVMLNINEILILLPDRFIENPDENVIKKMLSQQSLILKKYLMEIINGNSWV